MAKKKTSKKTLRKNPLRVGRDFDAWTWKYGDGSYDVDGWRGRPSWRYSGPGKWVRVRFVEVK